MLMKSYTINHKLGKILLVVPLEQVLQGTTGNLKRGEIFTTITFSAIPFE